MENNDLTRKRFKRAILLVMLTTLLGFSFIIFMPATYRNPFKLYLIFGYIVTIPVGLIVGFLPVLIIRLLFKSFLKEKLTYVILLIILMMLGYGFGFLAFLFTFRAMSGTL